ncbi:MAG: HAMP domain-containing sensor histidine kinase [Parvularculaceae bacterium]
MARIAAATIGLGILIGLMFSRTLLHRVDSVSRTARAIRDGDLSKRITLNGSGDEIDNLAINLNAMLDQIERLMTGMKEVSDNIAHDLRSPLNRIRGRSHRWWSRPGLGGEDEALRATLADAEDMIATFNALLSIARIESGEGAGSMDVVDLVAIAEEMAELYEPAAQDAGFILQLKTQPAPPVRGSRALISQALANLLDNALKYAAGGTTIRIDVRKGAEGRVLLSVLDDGPGVPASDRDAVVKRFVRLEQSRTTSGSGLGLSLVSAIARAHGGSVTLGDAASNSQRKGLKVTIAFPSIDKH